MGEPDRLVISMNEKIGVAKSAVRQREQSSTIYKVLGSIREEDPASYNPKMLSIGPFHYGNLAFDSMQLLKWEFLGNFLDRHPRRSVDEYIKKVKSLEKDARCYYSMPVVPESNAFVEMMVLDGCFIIEFLFKAYEGKLREQFPETWIIPLLKNDLLLLENQIPFIVLQCLYKSAVFLNLYSGIPARNLQLMDLVVPYFFPDYPKFNPGCDIQHLLHLQHSFLHPTDPPLLPETRHTAPKIIQSATELYEAGVKFEVKKDVRSFVDVTFRKDDGIMKIPMLSIEDITLPRFRNLIAFEQCCPRFGSHITSYMALMDDLINTAEDVALLKRSGVLESQLGHDEEVSKFFNSLLKGAYLDNDKHDLVGLFKGVKLYSGKPCHRWRAKMMHDYFNNPWSIFSLIGALVILFLTLIQALFAVLAYFRPTK